MKKKKKKMNKIKLFGIIGLLGCLGLAGCGGAAVPEVYTDVKDLPVIYPDYTNVTVPVNIAPLTFELDEVADEVVSRYAVGDEELVFAGKAQPDIDEWRALTAKAKGGAIKVDVFACNAGEWKHYKPFNIFVSPDSIDPWLSYRLIPPSYISYEALTISQRCLENYDERVIYDNVLCSFEKDGQCINCHHYQQGNPERLQFHARQNQGGTVIAYDGKIKKVNMRNDSILSAGVYPAWHPWLNLIVYSTDQTHQSFHTTDPNKVEVYDVESDIIAYNVEKGEVTNLENDTTEFEVFPAWAPDGKTLYYCSAHFDRKDSTMTKTLEVIVRSQELKYNIYKKSFDPETMTFGPRELVFQADSLNKSVVLPRVSPDGHYLLFTMSRYGYFHIWHHDADLWMLDLTTGEARPAKELNSKDTESYHTWSSSGRWVVFSSRRDDGTYTRPFFAHLEKDGHWTKPFELPCADPDYHRQFMKCYNIPEFMRGPVTIAPQTFADVLKGDGEPVKYVKQLTK
jgi:hypothetical protein